MAAPPLPQIPEPGEGKLETNISLRIVEAKNLLPAHDLKQYRDTFVITALDQEEIFRTATIDRSLSPFFSEEYSFRVPRDFSSLTFYLCEPGLHKDNRLGKVSIRHDKLKVSPTVTDELWYRLQHVDADSEVQGKIHLSLTVEEIVAGEGDSKQMQHMLTVRVVEAEGLSGWGSCGAPDPHCHVTLIPNAPALRSEVRRGNTRKKTCSPMLQDTFSFPFKDMKSLLNTIIRVSVWHDPLIGEKLFLGQVNLSIGSFTPPNWSHTGWYWLCSRPTAPTQNNPPDIGSLRIKVHYSQDVIYPLRIYDNLSHMLVESTTSPHLSNTAVFILGEVHRDWSAIGRSIVRIFLSLDKLESLIHKLIEHEVDATSDPNTLFRGNSLVSKVIDEFMKLVGSFYLQRTLQGCIDEIFDVRRQCEIDPSKLLETDNRDVNMANLLFFVEKTLSAIFASARSCPQMMCRVFSMLKDAAVAKFPESKDVVCFTSVSGFIFLRFFAPAILNPRLFHLRPEFPNPVVARTLTLISKSIQSLGNVAAPKLTNSLQHKETFMGQLQMELSDHTEDIKTYLTAISDPTAGEEQSSLANTAYREGMLTKRSQGRRKGPKNFRRRFFCLSSQCLTYSKAKGEIPLCTIPSHEMLAVERVDESAFGMKFMFQLVQPERILYLQAKNSVEEMEWLTTLSKACVQSSSQTLFHSGAYTNASWTCCGSPVEPNNGCKPISLAIKMLAQRESIDLERELHKVYKMFCVNQTKLIAMKDKATLTAREGDGSLSLPPRLTTLCELIIYIKNLELASTSFMQSLARRIVQGSRTAPHSCSSGEALVIS